MPHENGSAGRRICDPEARAAQPATCNMHVPERDVATSENSERDTIPRAEQTARTETSVRAETAYRDWTAVPPSQRPLALARAELAKTFDAAMHRHWLAGEAACSNVAVARACGVDEKSVRQWRDAEKPIPAAAIALLPGALYDEVIEALAAARGRRPTKRGVVVLLHGLALLRDDYANEDRRELRRVIRDVRRQLDAVDEQIDSIEVP